MTAEGVVGVLDTSVVIGLDRLTLAELPEISVVTTVTLGALSAGVHATDDPIERAVRTARLQRTELQFEALTYDESAAQHYGTLYAYVIAAGRNPRPRRMDIMIAATAASHRMALYTRNPKDFAGLEKAMKVIAV